MNMIRGRAHEIHNQKEILNNNQIKEFQFQRIKSNLLKIPNKIKNQQIFQIWDKVNKILTRRQKTNTQQVIKKTSNN